MPNLKVRQFWFITRPVRDPQYHEDALIALMNATNNFSVVWSGNREAHKAYENELIKAGMKRNNVSKDGSGGRTWAAMLKTYCYVYENGKGEIKPTKVGKAILNGTKIPENIKKQVLTLQIPNSYFLSSAFRPKFDEDFRIQPIIFLIRLANDDRLGKYISNEEITLFAMTAKRNNEYENVVNNILAFRELDEEAKAKKANEIFIAKGDISRVDSKPNYSKYSDVATTFSILSRFTEYVKEGSKGLQGIDDSVKLKEFHDFCIRYPFNNRVFVDPDFYTLSAGLDVDTYKTQYGVGKPVASRKKKQAIKAQQVLSRYPSPEELPLADLVAELSTKFNSTEAQRIAEDVKAKKFETSHDEFLDRYQHESDNLEFERETAHVLKGLGLQTEMHPKPLSNFNNSNEDIDIMASTPSGILILVDSKNYEKKFQLSATLRNKMVTSYLRGYMGYHGTNPGYYCYVTASKSATVSNLLKINELAKEQYDLDVHGMMISASALFYLQRYCSEHELTDEDRAELFLKLFTDEKYESFVRVAEKLGLEDYE